MCIAAEDHLASLIATADGDGPGTSAQFHSSAVQDLQRHGIGIIPALGVPRARFISPKLGSIMLYLPEHAVAPIQLCTGRRLYVGARDNALHQLTVELQHHRYRRG